MGLQSALTTALTGLRAAEASIDVVGNNVANSQTVGFKESTVNFATQFLQTQSIGARPSDASGGTNPRQIGLGVKVAEITPDFTQGTIEISSNPLDVAIQGEGFLIVQGPQGGSQQFYTRNGQLKTNENNEVVTVSGQRVLGFNAIDNTLIEELQPIRIPLGETAVTQPTENVFLNGSLAPQAEIGDQGQIIESAILVTREFEVPDDTNFDISNINVAAEPSTNGVSLSNPGGAGPIAGNYSYRAVFVDGDGNEGTISDFSVTSAGGAIELSSFQAAPSPYENINIYRQEAGSAGKYYLIGATSNPTTTPTITDNIVDDTALVVPANELDTSSVGPDPYSYYVTFVDPSNQTPESRPTKQIGPISTLGGRIRLDSIPQPEPGGDYDEIRIYRNTGTESSTFYEVATFPANTATSDVYLDSRSDADIATATANTLDLDGPKIGQSTLLTDVEIRSNQDFTSLFQEGELSYTGKKGDRTLKTKTFAITATSTVQELLAFIDQASGFDNSVANAAQSQVLGGRLQIASNVGKENAVSIGLTAFEITPTSTGLNVPISIPFGQVQPATGEGTTTDVVVYDTLGIPLTVRITTVRVPAELDSQNGTNTFYRWFATSADSEPVTGVSTVVGTGLLTFDGNGDFVESGSNTTVAVHRNATASQSPLGFDLDFSNVSGLPEQGGSNLSSSQDGFPPGILTSFEVTGNGEIRGVFSNGISTTLAQIRLARFTNNAGLQQVGANLYAEGVNSGGPVEGNPGGNGLGSLDAGAVELSNTDIGQNLIELILASTQYRGGARVISAVQELLDELLALRR